MKVYAIFQVQGHQECFITLVSSKKLALEYVSANVGGEITTLTYLNDRMSRQWIEKYYPPEYGIPEKQSVKIFNQELRNNIEKYHLGGNSKDFYKIEILEVLQK